MTNHKTNFRYSMVGVLECHIMAWLLQKPKLMLKIKHQMDYEKNIKIYFDNFIFWMDIKRYKKLHEFHSKK